MLRLLLVNDRIYNSAMTITEPPPGSRYFYNMTLTEMTVIKRRHDAVEPCDPKPSDDARIWNAVFNNLTCLPPYWKIFAPVNSTLLPCQHFEEFEKLRDWTNTAFKAGLELGEERFRNLFRGIKLKQKVISSIEPPCNEMGVAFTPQMREIKHQLKTSKDYFTQLVYFKVVYQMQKYQEIRNEKDYWLDTLWSNIGGFLGIFVGYSLINLLNNGYNLLTYLLKVDFSLKKPEKIRQKQMDSTTENFANIF